MSGIAAGAGRPSSGVGDLGLLGRYRVWSSERHDARWPSTNAISAASWAEPSAAFDYRASPEALQAVSSASARQYPARTLVPVSLATVNLQYAFPDPIPECT